MAINNNSKQFDVLTQKYQSFRATIPNKIAIEAVNFFKRNFELQGFVDNGIDKWKPLKNPKDQGRKILRKRGNLKNSLKKLQVERNKVVVGVTSDIKYAAIQNNGGQIPITPKMRRYFWAMFKQTGNEFFKGMALTKKTHLDIPARKYIGDSDALVKRLERMIAEQLNIALK